MSSVGGEIYYVALRTFFLNEEQKRRLEEKLRRLKDFEELLNEDRRGRETFCSFGNGRERMILLLRKLPFQPAEEFSCTIIYIWRYQGEMRRMAMIDAASRFLTFMLGELSLADMVKALRRQKIAGWITLTCAVGVPE